jgi:predicted dehydrogenase
VRRKPNTNLQNSLTDTFIYLNAHGDWLYSLAEGDMAMTRNNGEPKTFILAGEFSSRASSSQDLNGAGNQLALSQNPTVIPVVLFGLGEWSREKWFPVLVQLARWRVIHLTVVERTCFEYPKELQDLEREGLGRCLTWENQIISNGDFPWHVAFVVTKAEAHRSVIRALLKQSPHLKTIVCEKPCGESHEQARDIFDACQQRGVSLLVADHYLLRPVIQYMLSHPELICSIGKPMRITARLNEVKGTGPQQGVIADLLIHLLNVLQILFPGAQFVPDAAYLANALNAANTKHETYALAIGHLSMQDGAAVYCEIEGGKQLATNNKAIVLFGERGILHIDLISNILTLMLKDKQSKERYQPCETQWSYARLILRTLSLG